MGAFRSDGHALMLNVTGELALRNTGVTQVQHSLHASGVTLRRFKNEPANTVKVFWEFCKHTDMYMHTGRSQNTDRHIRFLEKS